LEKFKVVTDTTLNELQNGRLSSKLFFTCWADTVFA